MTLFARLLFSLIPLAFAACGGGGGGGGTVGGGGNANALTYAPSLLSVTLPVNAPVYLGPGQQPGNVLTAVIGNIPADTQALGGQYTGDGIESVDVSAWSGSTATLTVNLLQPETLAPGTYYEHVTLHACADTACANTIAGTDATIAITYKVTPPAAGQEPAVQILPTAVEVRALTMDTSSTGPRTTVQFELQHFGAQPFVKLEQTTNDILLMNANTSGTTLASADLSFQPPSVLGRGVYPDTLKVTVCLDSKCVNPVAGSPFTVPVTYTIDDKISVPGPNGYTLRAIRAEALGWAWDQTHGQLLVATKYASNLKSSILVVDPVTGTVISQLQLDGGATAAIEVSSDDQYLYVGVDDSVERFLLPGLQLDLKVPLGRDPSNTSIYMARNLRIMPDSPRSFAAAMFSGASEKVAVFDDGNMRPNFLEAQPGVAGQPIAEHLQWSKDVGTLYGDGYATAGVWNFYAMTVDATGIRAQTAYPGSPNPDSVGYNPNVLHPGGGLLYTETGFAIDPLTGLQVRQLTQDATYYSTQTDEILGRLYSLGQNPGAIATELRSLKLADGAQLANVTIPDFLSTLPRTLIRWGPQGLAYGTGGADATNFLVFVSGPAVAP